MYVSPSQHTPSVLTVRPGVKTLLSEGIECLVIVDSTRPSSTSSPSPSPPTTTIPTTTDSAVVEPVSPWIGLFDVRSTHPKKKKNSIVNTVLGRQRLPHTRSNTTHTLILPHQIQRTATSNRRSCQSWQSRRTISIRWENTLPPHSFFTKSLYIYFLFFSFLRVE